jgi:hypothetical protein
MRRTVNIDNDAKAGRDCARRGEFDGLARSQVTDALEAEDRQ